MDSSEVKESDGERRWHCLERVTRRRSHRVRSSSACESGSDVGMNRGCDG